MPPAAPRDRQADPLDGARAAQRFVSRGGLQLRTVPRPNRWRTLVGAWIAFALAGLISAAEVSFRSDVLPLLEQRCQACHSGPNAQQGLQLTSATGLIRGGASGAAVNPQHPETSLLIAKISGEKPAMPPIGERLTSAQIELIRNWIAQGAVDDTNDAGREPDATWWSLRPLNRPEPPAIAAGPATAASPATAAGPAADSAWPRTPIDRFILAKLSQKGLRPSAEASRRALIRRLTFDLHGLPPTPEQVQAFLNDSSPDAYEKLVDRLLASPRYGERWGRHWLDVIHYGESHGYDKDKPRRNAWRYRDYVIESLNTDKPYARFVKEQLAGDVLYPENTTALIATGFIAAGPWDYVGHAELREGTKDKKLARLLDRDDMLTATMSTFTSMTVHCARCHNHKFDPIPQTDYYSLQAVFAGVDRADRPYDDDPATYAERRRLLQEAAQLEAVIRPLREEIAALTNARIEALSAQAEPLRQKRTLLLHAKTAGSTAGERAENERLDQESAALAKQIRVLDEQREQEQLSLLEASRRERLKAAEQQRVKVKARIEALPKPKLVYAAASYFPSQDRFTPALGPRPVDVLARGDVMSPLETAPPGALTAVSALPARFEIADPEREGARRAALADWIVDERNPLTWRSIVNRVWHYHFGKGLVDSPNDFGRMGAQPTHPELLDWLAVEFRDQGGSLKQLHRLILLSAVYRQSSAGNADFEKLDASNQFLWRMNRARLDAESVRDSILAVTGSLDLTMGGPSAEQFLFKDDHSPVYDYARFDVNSPASLRRSVYRFIVRSVPDPFMESLDCPDASLLTPKRNVTLTAVQALALLNDPLVISQSRRFAAVLREQSGEIDEQIRVAYGKALGRGPRPDETALLAGYAREHGLENLCRLIFNSNEFLFIE
jgi:mono/diheme cytochrome c family protein